MSASDKVSMQTEEVLRVELEFFRQEHRDLDQAIVALSNTATADRLMIQRLKKKKLQLKDKITFIIEPYIRFQGKKGEQATMFFLDPDKNALEFKAFKNDSMIFEK